MKKFKIITVLLLIAIIASLFVTILVACDPTSKDDGNSGNSGNSGNDPEEWPDDPISGPGQTTKPPSMSQLEFLNKIVDSVEAPNDVLNINIAATIDDKKDTDYTVALKANIYEVLKRFDEDGNPIESTKGKNELAFTVHSKSKTQGSEEQLMFGMYFIGDKMYVDRADGSPLLYLSDFDFNYLVQIVNGAGGMLGDLISGSDQSKDILDLVTGAVTTFLLARPSITVNADKSMDVSMEVKINTVLDGAKGILGALGLNLPVEIGPIIDYLRTLIPSDEKFYITAGFTADYDLINVGFKGDRPNNQGFVLDATIELTDTASADIGVPAEADIESIDFSLTNIQFAIDLKVASQIVDGKTKSLDVGKLINGFLPTANIPEGLLLLEGGTGIRLSFKLDLDLDYDKTGVDKNKIAIELFLLDPYTGKPVEVAPQIGIYYLEGSFYLNTDSMLPNYLNGLNIKLDASMSELMDILISLITDAIDKQFGISFEEIRKQGAQLNDDGTLSIASASMLDNFLQKSTADVVALASDGEGGYKLSAGIANLVNAIAAVLGLGGSTDSNGNVIPPNLYTDDTSIKVVVNNNLFEVLGGLIPALSSIKLPNVIGDIVLSVNTFEGGIKDITIGTAINNVININNDQEYITVIDPALDIELAIGNFFICFEDTSLHEYINGKIDVNNTNYLTSLNGVIDHMLGGIRFSSGFNMVFDAGTYDLAPFIAGFGVKEVENSHILWEFTDKFVLDASLNLQIALNKTDTAKSMIVLEMKTESGIKVGNGEDYIIKPGQVLLGIYGYNNNIYIDISNFNIAGIVLPKLNFSLNFTDLVYTLLDDVVSKLLTQMGQTGGDLQFQLNFKDLFGIGSSNNVAGKEEDGAQSQLSLASEGRALSTSEEISSALIFMFNADKIQPVLSLATVLAILSATGTDLGNTLSEALKLMELDLSVEMTRKEGFKFSFAGEFIPKLDENGEGVYYFDADGKKIVVEKDKKYIYKNISERPEGTTDTIVGETVYYTTKKYNYGSNMKLVFQAGTKDFPVIVGNLGQHKYPIEEKVEDFKTFKSDLIQAIVDTVGKTSVVLDIDLQTLDNEMNLTKLINSVLANVGKKLELPISLDLDDWSSHVQLVLSWDLDLNKSSNSKILLELKYEEKVILGLYIYRNSIIVDLEGLGLFSGEIVNSSIVTKIFTMIDNAIKTYIGDLDLNKIINQLLQDAGLPTVGTKPEGSDQVSRASDGVATDGNVPTIGEGLKINDFIAYLTQAIRLEDTALVIDFTSSIINGMLSELVGINLGIDLGVNGKFDLFGDSLDLGIHVEDITMEAQLSLSIGKDVVIPVNFDDVPNWDASTPREFTTTLLNNLNIGFTIDLANYTNDTVNLQQTVGGNSTDNYRVFTRIIIEKITDPAGKILTNVGTYLHAPQGAFLVTLAHINEAMYKDNQSADASMTPMVYVIIDHRKASGQLTLAICSGLVTFLGLDIGNIVGVQYIDLDLVDKLSKVIDKLFKTINGSLDGLGNSLTGGGSASTAALNTPSVADEQTPSEPTGLDKVFAELDIIKLLGEKGIMLSLRANGNFNVTIEFDPYLMNKLIDDIMSWVFAGGTDHASIVNLQTMAPSMFNADYLSQVVWTREIYGQNSDKNSFWGSLRNIITPMLKGLVSGLGYGWAAPLLTDTLLSSIYDQIRKIVSGLLPFAVWNTATLEVNVVDATIANIHFRGQDEWEHIYYDNDETKGIAYHKDKSGRGGAKTSDGELFYTEIFIYNSSASVGEHPAKPDPTNPENTKGLVTWADIPTNLTYMPYIYKDMDDGVKTIVNEHFTNKTAIYQRGTTIMRAPVEFKILDEGVYPINCNTVNLKNAFMDAVESGTFLTKIQASATFSDGTTRTLDIEIEVRNEGGGIKAIDDIEMHAYDESLPDFLTVYTNDGNSRKINTKYLTVTNWRPTSYKAHDVVADVYFANGHTEKLTIHYLDSTVKSIIIGGVEGINVNVDLYSFNLKTLDITNYTPETLYFKYPDGKAVGLDVEGWKTVGEEGLFGRELDAENGKYSTNIGGYEFAITTSVAAYDGAAKQTVELIFTVKTKKVEKMTINDAINKISVDPYEYYMFKIGESDKNPFPSVATAEYYDEYSNYDGSKTIIDTYSEDVNIVWKNIEDTDFTWSNLGDVVNNNAKIALDNSKYDGTFTWEFPTQVSVLRNEVEAVYFDEELTQATFYIDPFQYVINGKGIGNFKEYAYVKFTNGAVYRMPIAWAGLEDFKVDPMNPSQFYQFDIYIGFDINRYNEDGTIISHTGIKGNLLQQTFVNVQVEYRRPKGLKLDGSALVGGTYYIDPVQVLYYGMDAFPSTVTVEYMSGKTSDLEVNDSLWIRDFEITMKGRKGLKATLELNEEYSFDIDVEIIDRSNLISQLTNLEIDPYIYTTDSNGNRVYSQYTDTMMLYQSVGSFDAETFEITGAKSSSMGTFAADTTYFVYKLVYKQGNRTIELTESDIDYIKDFVRSNEGIEIISTEIIEYFEVPIAWDLNEVNYSEADVYTVKAIVQAKNEEFNKAYKVAVNILAKTIKEIEGVQYIMVGGTNLSDAAKQSRRLTLNKTVKFTDGTSGIYECTIDLTSVQFDSAQAATLRNTTYSDGRVVTTAHGVGYNGEVVTTAEEIAKCAMNIKVTVCSGDIAQETTIKLHILDNVVATE